MSSGYIALTRQSGLLDEMRVVANNIANVSTTGYRREGLVFAEHVAALGPQENSVSLASADARHLDETQGSLAETGGSFDLAIEGPGYFLLETPDGQQLTRAGSFTRNAAGELAAPDGSRLLDAGGAPVFVPPDARTVSVAGDGTLSADGLPLTEIGLWQPVDPLDLNRRAGARLATDGGVVPADGVARILQGFVEASNVDPVTEIARMIEVQHAYQLGQSFLDKEDERIRAVLQTLGR